MARPIITLALMAGLAVALGGCKPSGNGTGGTTPPTPTPPPTAAAPADTTGAIEPVQLDAPEMPAVPEAGARMTFATKEHHFGSMPETETRSVRLPFRNTGDQTLTIDRVSTSCGCTAANLAKKEYASGEEGEIVVEFDPSAPGEQKQRVTVLTNAPAPHKINQVMIVADVQAFMNIEPRMLDLKNLSHGEYHTYEVIVSSPAKGFTLDRVSTSNPLLSARVLSGPTPREDGQIAYTVEATIEANAPWGGFFSWLTFNGTGEMTPGQGPIVHESKIRVQADLFGDLIASPDAFRFGCLPGEAFERRVRLSHADGEAFTVSAEVIGASNIEDVEVEVAPFGLGAVEIVLKARGGPVRMRGSATVILTTDVPGLERIELPVIGTVREAPLIPGK